MTEEELEAQRAMREMTSLMLLCSLLVLSVAVCCFVSWEAAAQWFADSTLWNT